MLNCQKYLLSIFRGKFMTKILFLFLIYIMSIEANEQGCTISFFKKDPSPCSSSIEKDKITIAPIVIKKAPKQKPVDTKAIEVKLHHILADVKDYKHKNQEKTKKLLDELTAMKKKFEQYKREKDKELKKVNKKLKNNKQKLVKIQKKIQKIYSKKIAKKVIKQKEKKKKTIIIQAIQTKIPETAHVVHKVIHKMQPLPIQMYDTPWIEIVVEDNIDIYDLALKYYGNKEAYKKIYLANKNTIRNDFKIYNGMSLIIPITKSFKENGILLNQ